MCQVQTENLEASTRVTASGTAATVWPGPKSRQRRWRRTALGRPSIGATASPAHTGAYAATHPAASSSMSCQASNSLLSNEVPCGSHRGACHGLQCRPYLMYSCLSCVLGCCREEGLPVSLFAPYKNLPDDGRVRQPPHMRSFCAAQGACSCVARLAL